MGIEVEDYQVGRARLKGVEKGLLVLGWVKEVGKSLR